MIPFLRWFPAYRDLEAELEHAAARAIEADDRVRLFQARCEIAEADKKHAVAELARSLRQYANYEARRNGSPFAPFPDVEVPAPEPVESTPSGPPAPQRRSLRDVQQEAVAQSRKAAHDRRMALANGDSDES